MYVSIRLSDPDVHVVLLQKTFRSARDDDGGVYETMCAAGE